MKKSWKFEIIYDTIQEKDNQLDVKMLCEIAGVSRSGYYRWVNAAEKREAKERQDKKDFEMI